MKKGIILAAALIFMAVILAYSIGVNAKEDVYTGGFNTYTVMPNETLWSIAGDIDSDKDIREIIYIIRQDNNMADSNIYAWQQLQLRTDY